MQYRVAFRNGMEAIIEAESLQAASQASVYFVKNSKYDNDVYLSTSEVLFVAPVERSSIERGAVRPSESRK
jgi:hypothetical protein